ncbi:MAG: hypothetical protein JOZ72_07750 [Alphaproteobacteria bacterium]|nr:hypothetical protein [Alphaproteobacteria bacterium]
MDGLLLQMGVAIVLALSFSCGGSRAWLSFRDRFYRGNAKPEPGRPDVPDFATLKTVLCDADEAVRKGATLLLDRYHEDAIAAQNRYQAAAAAVVAATLLGFLSFSFSLTLAEDNECIVQFCSVLDVACFGLALYFFFRATRANRTWISARIVNELLRQWCVLDNLLVAPPEEPEVASRFRRFAAEVEAAMEGGGSLKASEIRRFWETRRAEIEQRILAGPIERARFATHFLKRPWAQARWFALSRQHLVDQGRWRSVALLLAFSVTVVLSLTKTFMLVSKSRSGSIPLLEFLILTFIGASSALTAIYINQNARSLIHRYKSQSRQIDNWLSNYNAVLMQADLSPGDQLPHAMGKMIAAHVLNFEDLMIEELLDWVAISENDVMELSAS